MELVTETTIKKMTPKKGFVAPYIRFPWNENKDLIGKEAKIFRVSDSQFIIDIGNALEGLNQCKPTATQLNQSELKKGLPGSWSSGFDVALTRRRSPVRIRPGPYQNKKVTFLL